MCIYIYMCVCIYIFIYGYIHIYICVHTIYMGFIVFCSCDSHILYMASLPLEQLQVAGCTSSTRWWFVSCPSAAGTHPLDDFGWMFHDVSTILKERNTVELISTDLGPWGGSCPKEDQEKNGPPRADLRGVDDPALPSRSSWHQAADRIIDWARVTWQEKLDMFEIHCSEKNGTWSTQLGWTSH